MSEVITKLEDLKDKFNPEEEQTEDTQVPAAETAEKPDLADRWYQKHCERKLQKAQKAELKAEKKEAKKAEKQNGKKISKKTIGLVAAGAAVVGIVGKTLLDVASGFNQNQTTDSCADGETCDADVPVDETPETQEN